MPRRLPFLAALTLLCQCQPWQPQPAAQPMAPIFGPNTSGKPNPGKPVPPPAATPTNAASAAAYPKYPDHPAPAATPPPARTNPPPSAWRVEKISSPQTLAGGAAHYEIHLANAPDSMRMDCVIFDSRRFRLQVIDQPAPQAGGRAIADAMRAHRAAAGVNGGFFTPDFRPLGLVISSGRTIGAFEKSSLIAGMALQLGSQPYLIWNSEYQGHSGVSDLLQSGPRLVDSSRPVSGLEAQKRRRRTFIATDGGHLWALGATDSCSLAALAQALASPGALPGLQPMRALNLDGGNSTALWMRTAEGREISRPGWSTVRNYLAIVPK